MADLKRRKDEFDASPYHGGRKRALWSPDDISWDQFDASKVDPDVLCIVKAASVVEANGEDYATYLSKVFADDAEFIALAWNWAKEEVQHGAVLGRWAEMADPGFDFQVAWKRYCDGFRVDMKPNASIRGSRSGELIARCMVETGTSSYYTALRAASREPVLREICRRIAADELRHWKLFYVFLGRYLEKENIGFWRRLSIAVGRVRETEDDELPYAFYAANVHDQPYERAACKRAYARRAARYYKQPTLERAVAMTFKAVGLKPHGRMTTMASHAAAWYARRIAAKPDTLRLAA